MSRGKSRDKSPGPTALNNTSERRYLDFNGTQDSRRKSSPFETSATRKSYSERVGTEPEETVRKLSKHVTPGKKKLEYKPWTNSEIEPSQPRKSEKERVWHHHRQETFSGDNEEPQQRASEHPTHQKHDLMQENRELQNTLQYV